jgi:hypothetical protein
VILRLSLFVPINGPTILAWIALWAGLYMLFIGFHQLFRRFALLSTPSAEAHDDADAETSNAQTDGFHTGEVDLRGSTHSPRGPISSNSSERIAAPQVIRLESGVAPADSREMTQQAKIAAALTRAGITQPEAWSAAGVPYPSSVETADTVAPRSAEGENVSSMPQLHELQTHETSSLAPPVVLMKEPNDASFVISYPNRKEPLRALTLKSFLLISVGVAATALGVYLLIQ